MMYRISNCIYVYPEEIRDVIERKEPFLVVSMDLPFRLSNDVVIDIETTGLDPKYAAIISYGYVIKDKANVITLAYGVMEEFERFCRKFTRNLKDLGFRLWAWYCSFEEKFLGIKFNELQIRAYEKKDDSLRWGFEPPTNGSEVPNLYHEWIRYRDVKALWKIALRNLYDITIEAASLARKQLYEVINSD